MPPQRRGPICSDSNIGLCCTPGTLGMRDAWDMSHPNVILRQRGTGGAISRAESGEIVLARAGRSPIRTVGRRTKRRVYSELNLVGSFPLVGKPWKKDTEILADMKLDMWFPADKEFYIFANSKRPKTNSKYLKTPHAYAFLTALYNYPAKRVNLFTHGTVLSGKVKRGRVTFENKKEFDLLGPWYYLASNPGFRFEVNNKWRTLIGLRKGMPPGAKLIIYGCKSGSRLSDLKRLSKLLGVVAEGFSNSILYHAVTGRAGNRIVGWKYSHGKTGNQVDDYHKLTPDVSSNLTTKSP